jgi:hypothetical protein
MPNGFGFYWNRRPVAREYATLGRIAIAPGANGLVDAAQAAVTKLAAGAGVKAAPAAVPKSSSTNRDRVIIIVAAVAAIVLAGLARLALRRRRA